MIGSWLTTRAVFVFGALLILVGVLFISNGVPLVRLEIGWTEIIGGAVAASAGCIVLVLSVFLARLETLQESLDRLVVAPTVGAGQRDSVSFTDASDPAAEPAEPPRYAPVHPLAPGGKRERFEPSIAAVRPEPALAIAMPDLPGDELPPPAVTAPMPEPALVESAPALVHAEEVASHSPAVEAVVALEPARQRSSFLNSILARRNTATPPWRDIAATPLAEPPSPKHPEEPPLRPSVVDQPPTWDEDMSGLDPSPAHALPEAEAHHAGAEPAGEELSSTGETHAPASEPEPEPEPEPEEALPAAQEEPHPAPEPPPSEPPAAQPVVVGRYNAGSASYVMYSNGMIEVETEHGTHQFASMQELKAFIERRDTTARVY